MVLDRTLPARTVLGVTKRDFAHRTETFGFDTARPWALPALRLLFSVPRAYQPLVDAWERRHPGTKRALRRLVSMGFVQHQPAVVVNTRTGEPASRVSAPLPRYRASARGKRLAGEVAEDLRVLNDTFPHTTTSSAPKVAALLHAFCLETPHSRYGLSAPHATEVSGLPQRSGRWWVAHLLQHGYLVRLDDTLADVREVVPAHWRVTRELCRQTADVIDAFPDTAPAQLKIEFRLNRRRFLDDIDPSRIGLTGATDFDHDVQAQRVLTAMLSSPRCATDGVFAVEPRIRLPVRTTDQVWEFSDTRADSTVFYQPDAEIRERHAQGTVWRSVVEYERFQSRRDAWSHIERFLGWLQTRSLPVEPAVLRFVVDTDRRVRSYVQLIEAFADSALDHPERLPGNPVMLAVASAPKVIAADDPLDPRGWFRINLPEDGDASDRQTVLHRKDSPYSEYFSRG